MSSWSSSTSTSLSAGLGVLAASCTVFCGTMVTSAEAGSGSPAFLSPSRTRSNSFGSVTTTSESPSARTSSAPSSMAASVTLFSSTAALS